MKTMKMLALVLSVVLIASCASAPPPKAKGPCDDKDWITTGSGAFGGDSGRVLYGVGVASNINNFSLIRKTADNRAINELAAQLEVTSKSLMKDYMASTSAGDAVSEEQHVEQGIKTVVNQTLSGVAVVDRCHDKGNKSYYSLVSMDFNRFKGALEKSKELSERVKKHVKENADKVFDDLKKETGN